MRYNDPFTIRMFVNMMTAFNAIKFKSAFNSFWIIAFELKSGIGDLKIIF